MSEVGHADRRMVYGSRISPFGKVTIVQGNPGEGKTTFALRLAAACTNRKPFPHMGSA